MRITAKQYARALFEELEAAPEKENEEIIKRFSRILVDNNHTSYLLRIIKKFSQIWNKKKGIIEAEVITARKLEKDSREKIEKFLKQRNKDGKFEIDYRTNKNLIGGFVAKADDKIIDFSLATRLKDLENKIKD